MRSISNFSGSSRIEPLAAATLEAFPWTAADLWRFVMVERRREVIACIVLYALFATFWLVCYPHPFVFEDSIDLIRNASLNDNFGLRPIGHSYFLGALIAVNTSYYFVMGVQFLLIFLSSIFFMATIQFFYRPTSRVVSWPFTALVFCSLLVFFALANTRYIGIAMAAVPVLLLLFKPMRWVFINTAISLFIGIGTLIGTKSTIHDRCGVDTLSGSSGRARMIGVGLMCPYLGDDFHQRTFDDADQQQVQRMLFHCHQNRRECFEASTFFLDTSYPFTGISWQWYTLSWLD